MNRIINRILKKGGISRKGMGEATRGISRRGRGENMEEATGRDEEKRRRGIVDEEMVVKLGGLSDSRNVCSF